MDTARDPAARDPGPDPSGGTASQPSVPSEPSEPSEPSQPSDPSQPSPQPAGATATAATDPVVLVRRLDPGLPLPSYAHHGDAGADLVARVDVVVPPGGRVSVPTGVALALPDGYAGFVHPRSGLAARHGITVLNAPGTVDAGYRGEVLVTLVNTDGQVPFPVRRGDRVAQLVVQQVASARFEAVQELPVSARGVGGHGSTGGFATGALDALGAVEEPGPSGSDDTTCEEEKS